VIFSLLALLFLSGLSFLLYGGPVGFELYTPVFKIWVAWSIVLDYINLYKTRLLLLVSSLRPISILSLSLLFILDLLLAYAMIAVSYVTIQLWEFGGLDWIGFWQNLVTGVLVERQFIFKNFLYHIHSVLFFAGLVPSFWLWLFIAATILTRVITRSTSVLSFLVYFFDINEHPIRSLGYVAAIAFTGSLAMFLTIRSFI
jgi:hypothetical protein